MDYENDSSMLSFVSGLVLGAVIGAGIALLTAPATGRRTRRRLQRAASRLKRSGGERWEELADEVGKRADEAVRGARKRFS
jgi:gas vesicle protein